MCRVLCDTIIARLARFLVTRHRTMRFPFRLRRITMAELFLFIFISFNWGQGIWQVETRFFATNPVKLL